MLDLLAPRVVAASRRRQQELDLEDKVLTRSKKLFISALQGGKRLTRDTMYALLDRARISTAGQRGLHILWRLAHEGLICFGPREGKQPTFVLLEEWAPNVKRLDRDQALAELALRYFTGHGPATLQDFSWWSGLKISDARAAREMVASSLVQVTEGNKIYWTSLERPVRHEDCPKAHLLPGFDEFMLGYRDRGAALDPQYTQKITPENNGRFMSTMILNGRVVGTWRRTFKKDVSIISMEPFVTLSKAARQAFAEATRRYSQFIGMPVIVGG